MLSGGGYAVDQASGEAMESEVEDFRVGSNAGKVRKGTAMVCRKCRLDRA